MTGDGIISKEAKKVKPYIKRLVSKNLDIKDKIYELLHSAGYKIGKRLANKLEMELEELNNQFVATEPVDMKFICRVKELLGVEIIEVSKNKFTISDIIHYLAKEGIEPTLCYSDKSESYYYDLDSRAKSHMHLYEDFTLKFRYDTKVELDVGQYSIEEIIFDICQAFNEYALRGRDYCNLKWVDLCRKIIYTD